MSAFPSFSRPLANPIVMRWSAFLTTAALMACGGAAFQRAANAPKYGPLPVGTKIRIAASLEDLPSESQVIGVMHATTRGDPANRVDAEAAFKTAAGRYGCDAATGLESVRREIRTVRKVRTVLPDGSQKLVDETVVTAEHDWTAQCVRTPDAPGQMIAAAAPVAEPEPAPEPKPEAVRPKKRAPDPKPEPERVAPKPKAVEPKPEPERVVPKPKAPEPKPEPKPEPERVLPKPKAVEPKPEPKPEPERVVPKPKAPEPKPEPKIEPKPEPKPEPKVETRPKLTEPAPRERQPEKPADRPTPPVAPPTDPAIAKMGTEIARAFLQWSAAWTKGDADKICASFEDTVVINLSSSQPKIKLKAELTAADACASLKDGDLAAYMRELGPSEVHAEMSTLLPTLFGFHGGAYMSLDPEVQKSYAERVVKSREGKKPLQCTMYNVAPKDENSFQVALTCQGINAFKVIYSKGADGSWKVKQFLSIR